MNPERPSRWNTGAAIVSHNPDTGIPDRVTRVARQVDRVLIVDNHSNSSAKEMLRRAFSQSPVSLIVSDRNLGVATALNQAVHWAKQKRYRWLMTLDQDTVARDNLVETLGRVYDACGAKDAVAIIGARPYSERRRPRGGSEAASDWLETKTVITSGSVLSLDAWDAIGPFRDEFFIDLVDLDYCLRARQKGFKVILSLTPTIDHEIGAPTKHRLPWKDTATSNHPPLRRYYMMRNHVTLLREYLFKDPMWVITSFYSRLKSTTLMLLFEQDRAAKAKFTVLGLWDGLLSNFNRGVSQREGEQHER